MSELQGLERVPAAAEPAAAKEPRGIGGWLLLVGFGQVVGVLRTLVALGQGYLDPETLMAFEQYPLATYGELVLNLLLALLVIATAGLFFLKSPYFPRFFIGELVAAFMLPVLATVWVALALSIQLGSPVGDVLVFEPQETAQLGVAVVAALIWIPYTLKSRRVRNTFSGRDDPPEPVARDAGATTAPRTVLLQAVVYSVIAAGSISLLTGLGHAVGRGVFSSQLLGGSLQIALAIWLFRGSNVARIVLAGLYFVGFVFALSLPLLIDERGPMLFVVAGAIAVLTGVVFWILAFSERLRAELAINEARYRKPDPQEA